MVIANFRQLLRAREAAKTAMVPPGQRVYAVGDIHGRADLFKSLIAAIEADDAARGPAETTVVLLGDLIDRGPHSAAVLDLARAWQRRRTVHVLCGNHEEMLLDSLSNLDTLRAYLRHGGRDTVLNFGIDPDCYDTATYEELQALMVRRIPIPVLAFIRSFEEQLQIGDYLFVHAGIRPGVRTDQQTRTDLLWIREPFLSYGGDLGVVVVHGHTIFEQVSIQNHRIGIDTGAYLTGRLTAIGLQGSERWLIAASEGAEGITTSINCAA